MDITDNADSDDSPVTIDIVYKGEAKSDKYLFTVFWVFFRSLLLHCIALFCFWAHVSVVFLPLCPSLFLCFFVLKWVRGPLLSDPGVGHYPLDFDITRTFPRSDVYTPCPEKGPTIFRE